MDGLDRVAVIGGGAWGTALANAAALAGHGVVLWLRDPVQAAIIAGARENARYLPGVRLADRIAVTADRSALAGCGAALLVVPTQSIRSALGGLGEALAPSVPLVLCAKGIERATGLSPSGIAAEFRPETPVAVLSGPSFATDVARGLPTAVTLACADGSRAAALAAALSGPSLRVYHGTDVAGVEIGGAAKNVLAIAAGIVEGRGLGESAKAALVARGFAELLRFALASGARPETLMGLSGLGDLVLTCASAQSRNFAFGRALGSGSAPGAKLAEGVFTAEILVRLARERGVEMPVAEAVNGVLAGTATIEATLERLMSRPLRSES